jgi:hypothetical protein
MLAFLSYVELLSLLFVLVVVHLIERLRFSFSVLGFSFRMVVIIAALGLLVRFVFLCFDWLRVFGFSFFVLSMLL